MTVEYEDGKPDHLERVLVSCQYTENKKLEAGDLFLICSLYERQ